MLKFTKNIMEIKKLTPKALSEYIYYFCYLLLRKFTETSAHQILMNFKTLIL